MIFFWPQSLVDSGTVQLVQNSGLSFSVCGEVPCLSPWMWQKKHRAQLLLVDSLQPSCCQSKQTEGAEPRVLQSLWSRSPDQIDPEVVILGGFQLRAQKNFLLWFKPVWVHFDVTSEVVLQNFNHHWPHAYVQQLWCRLFCIEHAFITAVLLLLLFSVQSRVESRFLRRNSVFRDTTSFMH